MFRISTLAVLFALAFTVVSQAGDFAQKHPRRSEVNGRERNQRRRINQGVRNGTLTAAEAKDLKANEKGIKAQERADVKANGGYLTKDQKKEMNTELNSESAKIRAEKTGGQ